MDDQQQVYPAGLARWRTSAEVARDLGVTPGRIRQLAIDLGLGTKIGNTRLFTPEDVAVMRARRTDTGRAPKGARA